MMMYRDVQRFRAVRNFKIIKINTKTHQIWWVFILLLQKVFAGVKIQNKIYPFFQIAFSVDGN
jgi:hypothetical protein